jgi:hypothetical protein
VHVDAVVAGIAARNVNTYTIATIAVAVAQYTISMCVAATSFRAMVAKAMGTVYVAIVAATVNVAIVAATVIADTTTWPTDAQSHYAIMLAVNTRRRVGYVAL